jgi:pimeloyl-ACP methyl ester carboxylesterase
MPGMNVCAAIPPQPAPSCRQPASAPPPRCDFSLVDALPRRDAAGCRLYVGHDAAAPAPALLFVAGAYHGAWCYSNYLDFFGRRGMACFAIDLPGHGSLAQAGTATDLDIAALGRHLEQACRTLARPLVLVGHSMGALPVLLAASRGAARAVILLAPSPPGNLPGAQALPAVPEGRLKAPPAQAEIRARFLAVDDQRDVTPIVERLTPESPAILNDRYLLRVAVDAAALRCPGVCLEAQLDTPDRHPAGQDRAIADFLGLQHAVLPGQPHCMMYADRWAESAATVLEWYGRLTAATSARY